MVIGDLGMEQLRGRAILLVLFHEKLANMSVHLGSMVLSAKSTQRVR